LGLVKDYSKRIQQKAQFHGIDVGLEMYKTEFGAYPQSNDNSIDFYSSPLDTYDPTTYCGSNKLAEAMVGQDFLGFHPSSALNATGTADVPLKTTPPSVGPVNVYSADVSQAPNWQTADENINARKDPFVDLENANAFPMDAVYGASNASFPGGFDMTTKYPPLVLCDVFAQKRSGTGSRKTGTPILYFRARPSFKHQDFDGTIAAAPNPGLLEDDIYYLNDNINLLDLGKPDDGIEYTLMATGLEYENFENMIVNTQVQTLQRPYRADTYILISAGKDGDFGTSDDIFNFDKEVTE
jgi:hypothetical protein